MSDMKPRFLKTYGKQRRKLSAWILPDNHKLAFDSTSSTEGDISVFEPPKPTKRRVKRSSVASHKMVRPARMKKDMLHLTKDSFDEKTIRNVENVNIPPSSLSPPAHQSKTKRQRKTDKAVRPAKRKKGLCLTNNSSDEENICNPYPTHPQPVQQSQTTRESQLVSEPRVSMRQNSQHVSRRRKKRVPPTSVLFSAEKASSFALNESSYHGLENCSRNTIFCSTPFRRKHPGLKTSPLNDQSSMPLSISVSCIDNLSPFQKDVDLPGPIGSPRSVPLTGLRSKQHLSLCRKEAIHEQTSSDLFLFKKANTSEDTGNHSEDPKTKSSGELPCLNLLSTESESSSYFVTTTGALEWLIETLKEKCLSEHCTVQLERLDIRTLTQLCSETTYSSCLGDEYFVQCQQTNEHPVSVDSSQTVDLMQSSQASLNLSLSMTNEKSSHYLMSENSLDSSKQASSPTNSQNSNIPSSFTGELIQKSASVLYDDSTYHANSSTEFITRTQVPASNSLQSKDIEAIMDKYPIKKCTIQLNKLALSQLKSRNDGTITLNAKKCENDHTHNLNNSSDLVFVDLLDSVPKGLQETCRSNKLTVGVKTVTLSELKDIQSLKDRKLKSPQVVSESAREDQSESDANYSNEDTSMEKSGRPRSKDRTSSDIEKVVNSSCDILSTRKMSMGCKEGKRRSTSTDRPGTTRKACVSGLSVNRWRNKGNASGHMFRSRAAQLSNVQAVDCSINELRSMRSMQHKQQRELGPTMIFTTPVRASPLNISSLLADLTPNTYTWSRLKAALSVHRKGIVLLTPRTRAVSGSPGCSNLADISQDLFATPLRTPLPKRLQSQLHGNDSLVVCEDLSDAEKVYAECGQQRPLPWEECILSHRMKRCVKIGEGTFGEVFSTTNASGDTVALKIIPVEGSEKVNGEDQKTFGEILHEIIISKELSSLKEKTQNQTHCFIGLNDLHCVQGCYPPDFLNAWDRFDQQKGSENDRPDFFQNNQIFIILEFEFGGIDLENSNGTLASLRVAKSILHQVTAALAVAEQELHFEHRDLHWGNVLVKTTKQKMGSFLLNGKTHSLETKGVLVRIIDYSLSRLEIDDLTVSCDISNDEELFMGQGDYQFEIYRLMRKENGNNWSDYNPHTNVLWLHYLCSKLLYMKYRTAGGRGAKEIREELTRFYDSILQCRSATEALQSCPMFQ